MYLLFHPSTRYRSPTDPLLFVFSAYAAGVAGAAVAGAAQSERTLTLYNCGNYENTSCVICCTSKTHVLYCCQAY